MNRKIWKNSFTRRRRRKKLGRKWRRRRIGWRN